MAAELIPTDYDSTLARYNRACREEKALTKEYWEAIDLRDGAELVVLPVEVKTRLEQQAGRAFTALQAAHRQVQVLADRLVALGVY